MDIQYNIRGIALALLSEIYLNCDSSFRATVNCSEVVKEHGKEAACKGLKYLIEKKYVETPVLTVTPFQGKIMCNGIDWLEESYNVKLI